MTTDPSSELLRFPPGYGTPRTPLAWSEVRARLEEAKNYWLATVRPDGRPHVVPLDGFWLADAFYFGGSDETVKHRNLNHDARAVMHLEDAASVIIVEGTCEELVPDESLAAELSKQSRAKYGYGPHPATYAKPGNWRLRPATVLAWNRFPEDATRFRFSSG
jgi:nitroimidazol reductase NimA-like FMN-containing flavoprotein (pyridoxamine 5'-phosphate oxidase superfamily)